MDTRRYPSHRRLEQLFTGEAPDRTPILGGWIACAPHICAISGRTPAEFWQDPEGATIEAYRKLGTDGLIDVYVPKSETDFRFIDREDYWHSDPGFSLEEALRKIDALPGPEEAAARFDFDAAYRAFAAKLESYQRRCGPMLYMPAQWDNTPRVLWSDLLGYENLFLLIGLHPERIARLIEISAVEARQRNRLVARAVEEGLYPHAILFGEDVCNNKGLMIAPDFVEKHYFPALAHSLEPLLEAGCRPIWHSDGDIRPIVDPLIACGIQGFQGFQSECGVKLEEIVQRRTREGEPLIIFGPLSVAVELTRLTPAQVRQRVREAVDVCRGRARLVLFTSNTINPDVPLENIYAMYEAVLE